MPPALDRPPSATSLSPLSGRRLISRIASPFTSKTRSITDLCIDVTDPQKQRSPGDTVSGSVKLRVTKPTRVTHIVVCLHGFVQVYKNPGAPPAEGFRVNSAYLGAGRGSRSGEYFGNGFASLFEDEVVLCGDGRLAEGLYQFNFNLEFPDRDLPGSISFERGTISYVVTATITRPTTILPTQHCDRKVILSSDIDIAQFLPPRPRTITLEPLSRKVRARSQARRRADGSERHSQKDESARSSRIERSSASTSSHSTDDALPRSLSPSQASSDSRVSSLIQRESIVVSPKPLETGRPNSSKISLLSKTITCTVESLTGGCLRGDSIPVRVSINHTKHVKSLYGVIITFYRQARVDMHPTIPLGPMEKGHEDKYEDYYPKSLSGLGGLSLSGAGSSHVFRKDLAQVMLPLIVDPASLTTEVSGKVHVPDEAFPTITAVPGSMISFRYYVEVVVDIQGKLASQDRNFGNLGGLASTISTSGGAEGMNTERSAFNPFGFPVVDTAPIRRDKSVVTCTFEVIVGTRDSGRKKGKRKADATPEPQPQRELETGSGAEQTPLVQDETWYNGPAEQAYDYDGYGAAAAEGVWNVGSGYVPSDTTAYPDLLPVPMPHIEDESQLSEKERMRRAEARLLPSEPPVVDQAGEASHLPTAPLLPDEGQFSSEFGLETPRPVLLTRPPHLIPDLTGHSWSGIDGSTSLPRTPDYEPRDPPSSHSATLEAGDDKEELRRRALEAEASAPPADEADEQVGPSVPTLGDNDDDDNNTTITHHHHHHHHDDDELYNNTNDSHADASAMAGLPRYER